MLNLNSDRNILYLNSRILMRIRKVLYKSGIALITFLFIMLILFILFGALTYRIIVSNSFSRNNYVLTEAEFVANSAVRHALTIVANVGIGNFNTVNPPSDNTANLPLSIPFITYDLGVRNIPASANDIKVNNARLIDLTQNSINRDFSYRVCVWKYDPNNPNLMRIKVFVFYRNRLIKSFIFTIES